MEFELKVPSEFRGKILWVAVSKEPSYWKATMWDGLEMTGSLYGFWPESDWYPYPVGALCEIIEIDAGQRRTELVRLREAERESAKKRQGVWLRPGRKRVRLCLTVKPRKGPEDYPYVIKEFPPIGSMLPWGPSGKVW